MKLIKYLFLAFLVVVVGGGVYLYTSYESIVKKAVNKYGSEVTGTEIKLDGFKLALFDGEATIDKLTIANPNGYTSPYLFDLEKIYVKLDVKSLFSNTIVINKIEVKKPIIVYEMLSISKNNISDIQQNVTKNTASKPAGNKPKEVKKETSSEPGKNVVISSLIIDQGELRSVIGVAGKTSDVGVKFPAIEMKDIGKGKKEGESMAMIISEVLTKILATASQTVVNSNLSDLKGVAQENLDNTVSSVKDKLGLGGIFGK